MEKSPYIINGREAVIAAGVTEQIYGLHTFHFKMCDDSGSSTASSVESLTPSINGGIIYVEETIEEDGQSEIVLIPLDSPKTVRFRRVINYV